MANEIITTDAYKIASVVNNMQKRFMEDVNEDTLLMGTYGYLAAFGSYALQTAAATGAQNGNEALPIKAKLYKTNLTNAVSYGITNINATPSSINMMLCFIQKDLEELFASKSEVVISALNTPIEIGEFEFHLDYDIIISRQELPNKGIFYTARYNMGINNPLSNISSPFLDQPIIMNISGDDCVVLYVALHQVTIDKLYKKVISDNIFEAKIFDFELDANQQLANFTIKVTDSNDNSTIIEPVYEGMPAKIYDFCYYNYINQNKIRIKFDRDYYQPAKDSEIEMDVYYTTGSKGNFKYSSNDVLLNTIYVDDDMENQITSLVIPQGDSVNGTDKKSSDDIHQMVPKEMLARKTIITDKDLENFFNTLDSENRLVFKKKSDNQINRTRYAYMISKDDNGNIIPTNTLDVHIFENEFEIDKSQPNRMILRPGTKFIYQNGKAILMPKGYSPTNSDFVYSIPYNLVVNRSPFSVSYYLDILDNQYNLKTEYINNKSPLQFICTTINCAKNYLQDNKYKFTMKVSQNIAVDQKLAIPLEGGGYDFSNLKVAMVFSIDSIRSYYTFGKVIDFDPETFTYTLYFEIESTGLISIENKIKLSGMNTAGTNPPTDPSKLANMYITEESDMSLYFYTKLDKVYGIDNEVLAPFLKEDGYTLCDKVKPVSNIKLFYNYSNTIKSTVNVSGSNKDGDLGYLLKIRGVPMVRDSYISDLDRCNLFIDYLQYRKAFIDEALSVLENSFSVDLKFFNTFGPSQTFFVGYNKTYLNSTNLTLNFSIKTRQTADDSTIDRIKSDIKKYVEDINEIKSSIHMTELTRIIMNNYDSEIYFIEFTGFNNYGSDIQYIEKDNSDGAVDLVPEFLNINMEDNKTMDINIRTL